MTIFKWKRSSARSLTATLGIAFLELSVGALLFSGLLQGFLNFQTQRVAVSDRQQLIAQEASLTVASFVQEKFGVMETAIRLSNPATVSAIAQPEILNSLSGLQPAFRNMVLFDAEGRELAMLSDVSQSTVEGFVAQLKVDGLTQMKERYIGPVYFDKVANEPFVVMSVPAIDVFKDFQGTLVVEVKLKFMWDLVEQIQVGESGQAYVVDRQGQLIAFWDSGRVLKGDNVAPLRVVDEFIHSSAITAETIQGIAPGIDGALAVATYVPLGTPDWAVIVEMPWEEAYREVNTGILYTLGIMLVAGVGASMIGARLARRLAVPLVNLTDVATRIAGGGFDLEASVAGPYEVTRLAEAFNSMTDQLRFLINNLEARVSDRTRRLESVATIGEQLNTILNPDDLLRVVLRQIRQHFGYGRINIYLFDALGQVASVVADHAGESPMSESNTMSTDSVMEAARTRRIVQTGSRLSTDSDPSSADATVEIAVPIMQKGEVLGVLDVQAGQGGVLDDNDASLLRSLANQVAVALSNARLFGQMTRSKEEAEKAKERAEEAQFQIESQMWHATGQAQLSERIASSQGIPALANHVIKQLCQYLQIQVGALYVMEDNVLRLRGRYAHGGGDFRGRFALNEGLVGEAAAEKQMYRLSDIPQDTLTLSSSFGEITFRHSVAAPFVYEDQVIGVVELGSLQEFTPAQLQFLETAMERIGVAFSTALARAQVDELLERTQQMTAELQAQSEELRVANEELESQTESLSRSEAQLREKQVQLESVNVELEEKAVVLQEQQDVLNRQNRDLKTAQGELEQKAQELAQASKYKSEFLANMSHELRTPLNSLLILAGMLRKNDTGNLSEDQVESLSVIHNSGRDLLELINEILDLSKIEAGRMEFRFEPLSLRDLADAMASQFTHVAEQKGLEFTLHLDEHLPERIVGDVQRISQIVKNLLSNAFKFTEHGGVYLEIHRPQEAPKSLPSALLPEQMVTISVRDTGIGIDGDKQRIIFEAFQQADGSTSRKYGGTGLGLSISRELAFRMGGMIVVSSVPGQGSTFTLYLPEAWSAEDGKRIDPTRVLSQMAPDLPVPPKTVAPLLEEPPRPPVVTFPDDRERVTEGDRVLLIVEDDLNFAKIVCELARRKAFKCLVAGDGESGLSLVKTYHPDAVLLDLRLPGMSGWMVLRHLKDNPDTRHIPVHIMSVEERVQDAYKRGAMGFLTKPVSVEDLTGTLGKIEQFIDRRVKSLLLVEDDENLRHSVKKLLEGSDVKITEAGTGQQALDALRSTHVDCMILDLSLPDMSGLEVLRGIHDDETVSKCPVIIYTGQELAPEEHQQLLLYADSVIVKEVKSPERLLDETSLFLHRVVADMPAEKQRVIKQLPDRESVLQGKRVLVVDDDMRNSFALSKLLHEKGIAVQVAPDGRRALELLDKTPDIDLVLMDIMMPVMDGYETIRQIRSQIRFQSLPILALTAKAMKGDREKCLEVGANDYLPKPIDEDRLFSMLRVWLYR